MEGGHEKSFYCIPHANPRPRVRHLCLRYLATADSTDRRERLCRGVGGILEELDPRYFWRSYLLDSATT